MSCPMKLHLLAWLECPLSSMETLSWRHTEPLGAPRTTLGCRFELSTYVMPTDTGMGGTPFYSHLPFELAAPYLQRAARPVIHLEEKENSISVEPHSSQKPIYKIVARNHWTWGSIQLIQLSGIFVQDLFQRKDF